MKLDIPVDPDMNLPMHRERVLMSPPGWLQIESVLSDGDANGTWQRFIIISAPQGPNSEGGPSSRPADGPPMVPLSRLT
jgi:hypothetical protein